MQGTIHPNHPRCHCDEMRQACSTLLPLSCLESYVMQLTNARSSHALIFCVLVPGGLEDLNHRAARVGKIFEPSPCLQLRDA